VDKSEPMEQVSVKFCIIVFCTNLAGDGIDLGMIYKRYLQRSIRRWTCRYIYNKNGYVSVYTQLISGILCYIFVGIDPKSQGPCN
jgi:hypothetical protein